MATPAPSVRPQETEARLREALTPFVERLDPETFVALKRLVDERRQREMPALPVDVGAYGC